jgi:hypothetical protein
MKLVIVECSSKIPDKLLLHCASSQINGRTTLSGAQEPEAFMRIFEAMVGPKA